MGRVKKTATSAALCQRWAVARTALGWSIQQASLALNIGPQRLAAIETGRTDPGWAFAHAFASNGLCANWFYSGAGTLMRKPGRATRIDLFALYASSATPGQLRRLRETLNMQPADADQAFDLRIDYWSELEAGQREPDAKLLCALASRRVDINALMCDDLPLFDDLLDR